MFESHYPALVTSYFAAFGGWLLACRVVPTLWPKRNEAVFSHPWREVGIAILAGVGILAVGQLWQAGIRLPETGRLGPISGVVNQFFIFAPMLLMPIYRKQSWDTAWLPRPHLAARLGIGVALAALALVAYSLVRGGAAAPWEIAGRIVAYNNLDLLAQVFFEDVVIAILFVRLAAAIGGGRAVGVVAALFAVGHVPAMLGGGAGFVELIALLRDVGLGVVAISVLRRARDIIWFWPVHFTMDMTQFSSVIK